MFVITIVFLILLSIAMLVSFIVLFLRANSNKRKLTYEPILFFLEINLKEWRIKKSNSIFNNFADKFDEIYNLIEKRFGGGWMDISTFLKNTGEEYEDKWRKSIEFCIQNKSNIKFTQKMKFKSIKYKKEIIRFFDLQFQYVNENNIIVEVKSKDKHVDNEISKKVITKEDMFNDQNTYKLFIGFSINGEINLHSFKSFASKMEVILKNKDLKYFKSNSMIVMFLSNNSYKKIVQWENKFKKKLQKQIYQKNISNYFDGITFVECLGLNNETDFSKVMTRISFGLIKSKLLGEPIYFFNNKTVLFNEFEEFKEKIMKVHNMVELDNIDHKNVDIFSVNSNKKIYDYVVPVLNLEDDYWNDYILKLNDFDKKIEDQFATNILQKKHLDYPNKALICINDYHIEALFNDMKRKTNFIYIIKRARFKDVNDFVKLLRLLELSRIEYGIFVESLDSQVLSILSNSKPRIIVLSDDYNSNFYEQNIKNKLELTNTITLCDHLNITLLFTNIDSEIRNSIKIMSTKQKLYTEKRLV